MTRQEWIDSIEDFSDLISFCIDSGYQEDKADHIISDYDLDRYVEDDLRNCDYGWQSIRDYLANIPQGYDWYLCDGYFDYTGLTSDDFEDWKSDVLSELDDDDYFDEDEEEDAVVEYRSQDRPKWMCFASMGDEEIPSFDTNVAALGTLLGMTASDPVGNTAESQRSA